MAQAVKYWYPFIIISDVCRQRFCQPDSLTAVMAAGKAMRAGKFAIHQEIPEIWYFLRFCDKV